MLLAGLKRVNQDRVVTHTETISFYKAADNKILKRNVRIPDRNQNYQMVIATKCKRERTKTKNTNKWKSSIKIKFLACKA